jgi:hypothetical protein
MVAVTTLLDLLDDDRLELLFGAGHRSGLLLLDVGFEFLE